MRGKQEVERYDEFFQVVVRGCSGVGKSNIISRFTRGKFSKKKSTNGIEYATRTISVDVKQIKLQVADVPQHERIFNRTGEVIDIFVYDISKRLTLGA